MVAWIEHEVVNSTPGKLFVKRWNATSWLSYETTPASLNVHTAGAAIGGQLVLDNNNRPNVAWLERETYQNGAYNVYLKRWNGTAWVQNGAGGEINNLDAWIPRLVIDSVNKPVVTWTENDNNVGKVFVKRFDTSWTFLGTNPINTTANKSAFEPRLALNNSGNPVIAWTELPVGNGLFYRTIFVKQWNGSQWTRMGNTVDTGTTSGLAFDSTNTAMVLVGGSDLSVRRFVTGGWEPLSNALDNTVANSAILSSVARTSNNRPIVAWRENVDATNRNIYVKEWTGTLWRSLGAVDRNFNNPVGKVSIAMRTDNRPVVAWNETSSNGYRDVFVSRHDGTSWIPLGGALSSVHNDEWPVVVVNSSNTPFVTWQSCNTSGFCGVYVKKWDGVNWVDMRGLTSFSPLNASSATFSTITLDINGNPVVAWSEYVTSTSTYTVRVKRWNGINWGNSVLTITGVTTYDISIDVASDNTLYLAAAKKVNVFGTDFSRLIIFTQLGSQTATLTDSQNNIYLNHNSNAYSPSLELDSNNRPVVAWQDIPFTSNVSNNISVKRWDGTNWSNVGPSIEDTYFDDSMSPDVVLKTNGNPIVSFTKRTTATLEDIVVKQY